MWIVLIVLNILLATVKSSDDADLRVINGRETFQRFLADVYIKVPKEHITCSASILSRHWLITAGHCFDEGPHLFVKIYRFNAPSPIMDVDRIVVHPLYRSTKMNGLLDYVKYDLALLKTKEPMALGSYLQPVPMGEYPPAEGTPAIVSGFGKPDLEAREGDMRISYCNGMLCTHSIDEQTRPGQGDSGGPLIANGMIVGVDSTSVHVRIAENRRRIRIFHTEYFSDIASNYEWIQSVINERNAEADSLLRSG